MDFLGAGTLYLAVCLCCLAALSLWRHTCGNAPPGPFPLPLIGNLLCLDLNQLSGSLIKLSEKYGPVYTIQLGTRRILVLCGYEAVKEALVDQADDFSDRGQQATIEWIFRGYGVAFRSGEKAKQLRRFSITTLRNFGLGKRSVEARILEEAHFLLEALRSTNGAPFDPTYFLSRSVSNIISSFAFGNRFDYEDKEFLALLNTTIETFQFASTSWGQLFDIFPGILEHLPGPQQKVFKKLLFLEDFIVRKVKAHQETLDPNFPRDFIDCFLVKMLQEKGKPDSAFSQKDLVATTLAIFFGGTETVSTTLRHGLLILLKYPEVEEKIHEEIDRVIGQNRIPCLEDQAQMPYTEAVIHEIQRFADLLPVGLPRRVTRDTQLRGYSIHKGMDVFPMLGTVLRDPKHFARPDTFDPQHFLDRKGQFKKSPAFLPFCIGNRYCFGDVLARAEFFLFLTSILQNFRFKSLTPPAQIDTSPLLTGFSSLPRFYEICVIPR